MFSKKNILPSKSDRLVERLKSRLLKAYEGRNYRNMREISDSYSIPLLVSSLEKISNYDLINIILLTIDPKRKGDLFLSFSPEYKLGILNTIRPIALSKLLECIEVDKVIDLLSYSNSSLSKKIIYSASPQLRKELNLVGNFSHSQAGSIMNTIKLTFAENFKISQALNYIKKRRKQIEIDDEIFVVNLNREVVGLIDLQTLFFSGNNALLVGEIMNRDFFAVQATSPIGELIDLYNKYNFSVVAVLNNKGQLLGSISERNILPEIIDENIEDVYRFYGIVNFHHSYMKSSVLEVVKSRLFWLIVLLFATTLTTFIIDKFESLGIHLTSGLSSAVLVPMIPLITDMCGNSGSQTAATIIQSFASDELKSRDFWRVLKKELKISVVVGGIISILNFVRLLVYFSIFPIDSSRLLSSNSSSSRGSSLELKSHSLEKYSIVAVSNSTGQMPSFVLFNSSNNGSSVNTYLMGLLGSGISSISLFLVIVLSKLTGVIIPYIAYKMKKDPAALTTPVLTTFLDAIGTLIFFSIGILLICTTQSSLISKAVATTSFSLSLS